MDKVLSNMLRVLSRATEISFMKGRDSVDEANFTAGLFEENATATPTFSRHQFDWSAAINIETRPSISKRIMTCRKLR